VEGEYTEDATLDIIAIGQPPCEPRDMGRYTVTKARSDVVLSLRYRSIYGHIDFLGKGATSLVEDASRSYLPSGYLTELSLRKTLPCEFRKNWQMFISFAFPMCG